MLHKLHLVSIFSIKMKVLYSLARTSLNKEQASCLSKLVVREVLGRAKLDRFYLTPLWQRLLQIIQRQKNKVYAENTVHRRVEYD